MIKIVCAVLVLAVAWSLPPHPHDDVDAEDEAEWAIIEGILYEAGVDVVAVSQKMDEYWKTQKDNIAAIIQTNLPSGLTAQEFQAKAQEFEAAEGTGFDKWGNIRDVLREYGAEGEAVIDKIKEFTDQDQHWEKLEAIIKEHLPAGVDENVIHEKLEAAFEE